MKKLTLEIALYSNDISISYDCIFCKINKNASLGMDILLKNITGIPSGFWVFICKYCIDMERSEGTKLVTILEKYYKKPDSKNK